MAKNKRGTQRKPHDITWDEPEAILSERTSRQWESSCDQWWSHILQIAEGQLTGDDARKLSDLSREIAFKASGDGVDASALRLLANAVEGVATSLCDFDMGAVRPFLNRASVVVDEVRDRAIAKQINQSKLEVVEWSKLNPQQKKRAVLEAAVRQGGVVTAMAREIAQRMKTTPAAVRKWIERQEGLRAEIQKLESVARKPPGQ